MLINIDLPNYVLKKYVPNYAIKLLNTHTQENSIISWIKLYNCLTKTFSKKKGKKKKKALWIWKSKLPRHGQHVRAMSYIQFSKYTQFVEGNKQTRYWREICSNAVSNVLSPIDNGIISNRGKGQVELVVHKNFYFTSPMCKLILPYLHTSSVGFHITKQESLFSNPMTG